MCGGALTSIDTSLDTEELAHNAHMANGNVHILASGLIYLNTTPTKIIFHTAFPEAESTASPF